MMSNFTLLNFFGMNPAGSDGWKIDSGIQKLIFFPRKAFRSNEKPTK